jgi:hypothetical protein
MDKEIQAGAEGLSITDGYKAYVDPADLDRFKATVPYCVENQFDNSIEKMLQEREYYQYLRIKNIDQLWSKLKSMMQKNLGSVLSILCMM